MNLTGDPDADRLLDADPFALLVGMLLDQQVPMETAFAGPAKIAARMSTGDHLDPGRIAAADPEEFAALCATPPAVHRFPSSMAERIQAAARAVVGTTTATPPGCGPTATRTVRRCSVGSASCPGTASRRPRSSSPCSASSAA